MADKRLYRSRSNRIIAGVAAGIADYFDVDPVIVRLIFVVLTLGQGAGLLAYVIGWIIIPEEPETAVATSKSPKEQSDKKEDAANLTTETKTGSDQGRVTTGAVLILLGLFFLMQNVFGHLFWRNFWPLVFMIIGLALITRSIGSKEKK